MSDQGGYRAARAAKNIRMIIGVIIWIRMRVNTRTTDHLAN